MSFPLPPKRLLRMPQDRVSAGGPVGFWYYGVKRNPLAVKRAGLDGGFRPNKLVN
jgi:hypothetical protein